MKNLVTILMLVALSTASFAKMNQTQIGIAAEIPEQYKLQGYNLVDEVWMPDIKGYDFTDNHSIILRRNGGGYFVVFQREVPGESLDFRQEVPITDERLRAYYSKIYGYRVAAIYYLPTIDDVAAVNKMFDQAKEDKSEH